MLGFGAQRHLHYFSALSTRQYSLDGVQGRMNPPLRMQGNDANGKGELTTHFNQFETLYPSSSL